MNIFYKGGLREHDRKKVYKANLEEHAKTILFAAV